MKNLNPEPKSRFRIPGDVLTTIFVVASLVSTFISDDLPKTGFILGLVTALTSSACSWRSDSWGALRILATLAASIGVAVGISMAIVALTG